MRTGLDTLRTPRLFYTPDVGGSFGQGSVPTAPMGNPDAWKAFAGAPRTDPKKVGIDAIPDVHAAQDVFTQFFPASLFPRASAATKQRLANEFPNWDQGAPEIIVARKGWDTLRMSLGAAGSQLPLAVVTQISYGPGMGHPKIGLFRDGKFPGESPHTYLYHAAIGNTLRGGQGADYNRLDHVPSKPTLYAFWILSYDIAKTGAEEAHRRWGDKRYTGNSPGDCATFVTDLALHLASIGNDSNNPFNYDIKSRSTLEPAPAEDRGMYSILKNAHRPPAGMIFVLDPKTYDNIAAHGHKENGGWVVDADACEFNVTRQ